MGKTAGNAIWLDPEQTSPYDYYQYWRNTDDADVGQFLRVFTFLPIEEIAELERLTGADINRAKEVLAFEATRLTHGDDEAQKAQNTARARFGGDGVDEGPSVAVAEPTRVTQLLLDGGSGSARWPKRAARSPRAASDRWRESGVERTRDRPERAARAAQPGADERFA